MAHVDNPKFVKELTLNRDKVVQLQANLTILKEMKISKLRNQLQNQQIIREDPYAQKLNQYYQLNKTHERRVSMISIE